jgi:hypothetical protein
MENTMGNKMKKNIFANLSSSITDGNSSKIAYNTVNTFPTNLPESEKTEATGSSSAGGFSAPLFGDMKEKIKEKEPKKVEAKEATGSSSSGSYEQPSIWAKSSTKKHWKGARKTQLPGGKFVEVKKKCQKFPYCNQGDIKSLNIFENERMKEIIKNISKKHNISETFIRNILKYELNLLKKYDK